MSAIREDLVLATVNRAVNSIDYNIHNNIHNQEEFIKQKILTDSSLTNDEKTEAIRIRIKIYDQLRILYNSGARRICENCKEECLATSFCEYCIRNYLKANFSNWTSGNNDIDNLIQKCQMEANDPSSIVEWIPYDNFEDIKYLTKGGFSEIYTAIWTYGYYYEWDSKKQQLTRYEGTYVVLKTLENVESANQNWFEEVCILRHMNLYLKILYLLIIKILKLFFTG
jgi:hypothetical protein